MTRLHRVAKHEPRAAAQPREAAPSRANNPFASRCARYYDLWLSLPPVGQIRRSEERTLAGLIQETLRPGDSLLEVGPGTGRYTAEFARQVSHVTAVEQSAEMIPLLERRLACHGLSNCSVIEGDFAGVPIPSQFDVVALIGVLDYVSEPKAFLARAAAFARRAMLFTTPHCGALARAFRLGNGLRGVKINNYTPEQVRSYLEGFEIEIMETGLRTRLWRGMTLACRAVRR